jgi:hypothetical protein
MVSNVCVEDLATETLMGRTVIAGWYPSREKKKLLELPDSKRSFQIGNNHLNLEEIVCTGCVFANALQKHSSSNQGCIELHKSHECRIS